jgi:hypothetical protein
MAERLVKGRTDDDDAREVTAKRTPSLGFYAIAIGIVLPRAAVIMYLAIAVFLLLPLRTVVRHARRRRRET